MNRVCKPYFDKFFMVFIDDILIYSKSKEDHEVHFKVGVRVAEEGEVVCLVTIKFFIANFSKITKLLASLTQKNQKYEWDREQEEAFHTLKDNLCNTPILSLPDGPEDFVVYCDASNQGLGCIHMQRGKSVVKRMILVAYNKAFKEDNATTKMMCGLDQLMERKEDGEDYKMEKLSRLYIDDIVAGHGVPMSIISDRDGRFTSRVLANITESLRDAIGYGYGLSSSDGWTK
ncbi:putative reverse transcriptase domain-containing protein [Tanacetum coccineum]